MMVLRNHDALSRRRMAAMQDPVTGVYQYGQRFQGVRNAPLPCFRYATARLTGFEKMLGRTDETLTYHLCGYGLTPGESLVSLVGETAERFSYVASQALLGDRVVRASYADLVRDCEANGDRLCPLSLVNVVYDPGTPHWVEETDELTWLRMTSASDTSRCVLIPLQMVLPYSSGLFADEPRILPSAVSTGTACHETFEHALENCLIEYFQIDSFNLWWFAGVESPVVRTDTAECLEKWGFSRPEVREFARDFEVTFHDITLDKPMPIFVCEIRAHRSGLPQYTVGVQGAWDREHALYRAFMECLAVLDYNMNSVWLDADHTASDADEEKACRIDNLDDNVALYARRGCSGRSTCGITAEALVGGVGRVNGLSDFPHAGFLDITAPEFAALGMCVVRLVVPELIPMCLPSFPQRRHPRYALAGGVVNDAPHPLA